MATIKGKETAWYFLPLIFFVDAGSNIRDPVFGMEKIRIQDKPKFSIYCNTFTHSNLLYLGSAGVLC
jgi:hypothetical protein